MIFKICPTRRCPARQTIQYTAVEFNRSKKACQKWDSNPRLQLETRTLVPLMQCKQCLSLAP